MRIELVELETFIAVAELGSFSRAAQQLHVTQPSVTNRVKALEAALGTRLVVRTTRKMELTAQGARLLKEAKSTMAGLKSLVQEFLQDARLARHRVVVGTTPMMAAAVVPSLIRDYSRRYTNVQVQLVDLRHPDLLAALDTGAAEVGLLVYDGDDKRFHVEHLWTDDMVLVVPRKHALASQKRAALEEIAACDLIVIEPFVQMRQRIADELALRGVTLPPSTMVGMLTTVIGMLDAGIGVALMTRWMSRQVRNQPAGHVVLEIDGIKLERNYCLLYSRSASLSTAAQSFCGFLRSADPFTGSAPE